MRFWLGGYTPDAGGSASGIGVLHAGEPDAPLAGGDLGFAGTAAPAPSPSWIAAHPTLGVLYAAQEGAGTVQAFLRTGEERYAVFGPAREAGELVCHVAVAPDGRSLIAACWGDGRVVRYPLAADGQLSAPQLAATAEDPYADPTPADEGVPDLRSLEGFADLPDFADLPLFGAPDALPERLGGGFVPPDEPAPVQERTSRAHQTRFLPGGTIVTTDMGFDLVRFWAASGDGLRHVQHVVLPKGSGPRHTVWHPSGHLYVVTELSHEVFVLAQNPAAAPTGRWRIVSASPLAPATVLDADFAAEIALTREAQFAIVGIRGSNTLAALRVRGDGSTLSPVALMESGVDWPRHHVIERDTVLVAGQRSNDVASLALDERTGIVGRVRKRVEAPSPTRLLADRG